MQEFIAVFIISTSMLQIVLVNIYNLITTKWLLVIIFSALLIKNNLESKYASSQYNILDFSIEVIIYFIFL